MRRSTLGWLACVLVVFSAAVASAERDAGASGVNSERGSGVLSTTVPAVFRELLAAVRPRAVSTPVVKQPRSVSIASRPTSKRAVTGDTVTIVKDGAPVMRGSERLGTLDKGHQFKVLKVLNGWLGTVVEDGGQAIRGWVWHEDAAPVTATPQPGG